MDEGPSWSTGWPAAEVVHLLHDGRNWDAVTEFYRRLVVGEAELASVGLGLDCAASRHASQASEAAAPWPAATEEPYLGAGSHSECHEAEAPMGKSYPHRTCQQPPQQEQEAAAQQALGIGPCEHRTRQASQDKEGDQQLSPQRGLELRQLQHQRLPRQGTDSSAASGRQQLALVSQQPEQQAIRDRRQQRQLRKGALGDARLTFRVQLSYLGPAFQGWKWQKDVRETLEEALHEALAPINSKAGAFGQKAVVVVAGRTDKGVHAYRQTISFYTWDEVDPQQVLNAINSARPLELRAWHAEQVPRAFHATFQARWRRYLYLFPLGPGDGIAPRSRRSAAGLAGRLQGATEATLASSNELPDRDAAKSDEEGQPAPSPDPPAARGCHRPMQQGAGTRAGAGAPPTLALEVEASRVHRLLQPLVGRDLDFTAFARDTPPGKGCACRLLRARAWRCELPGLGACPAAPALAVELVGTRFLKRMVRVLVASAVREAVPQAAWFPATLETGSELRLESLKSLGGARPAEQCLAGQPGPTLVEALAAEAAQVRASPGCGVAASGDAGLGGLGAGATQGPPPPLNEGALLEVLASRDRRISAPPAPAVGLCFLEAAYSDCPTEP